MVFLILPALNPTGRNSIELTGVFLHIKLVIAVLEVGHASLYLHESDLLIIGV